MLAQLPFELSCLGFYVPSYEDAGLQKTGATKRRSFQQQAKTLNKHMKNQQPPKTLKQKGGRFHNKQKHQKNT